MAEPRRLRECTTRTHGLRQTGHANPSTRRAKLRVRTEEASECTFGPIQRGHRSSDGAAPCRRPGHAAKHASDTTKQGAVGHTPLSALTPPATATSRLGQVPCESADKSGARARERAHLTGPRLRGTPQSTCPARPSPSRPLRAGRLPKPTRPAQNAGPWKSVRSAASTIAPQESARMVQATGP